MITVTCVPLGLGSDKGQYLHLRILSTGAGQTSDRRSSVAKECVFSGMRHQFLRVLDVLQDLPGGHYDSGSVLVMDGGGCLFAYQTRRCHRDVHCTNCAVGTSATAARFRELFSIIADVRRTTCPKHDDPVVRPTRS